MLATKCGYYFNIMVFFFFDDSINVCVLFGSHGRTNLFLLDSMFTFVMIAGAEEEKQDGAR